MTVLRTKDGQSTKISQEEAVDIAGKLLGKTSLSKSAGAVRCDVLTRPSRKLSKSGTPEPDTMMYVLNYGNSDGYALICADKRVPDQVLAYSETGEMDLDTDNPGLQMFMDMAVDYMDIHIENLESSRDSIEAVLQGKFDEVSEYKNTHLSKSRTLISSYSYDYWHGKEVTIDKIRKPLLRTYWHQGKPYNNHAPMCYDTIGRRNNDPSRCDTRNPHCTNRCLAGCVAVATGQLMAYWKWPKVVDGVNMDWNSMQFESLEKEEDAREDQNYCFRVARLLRYIGDAVGMEYGCAQSSASSATAVDYLSKKGYYTYGLNIFNDLNAVQSLNNGAPVLIRGNRTYDPIADEYHNGHAWLLDGYVEETITQVIKNMRVNTYRESNGTTSTEVLYSAYLGDDCTQYYFHCNWGWGYENGYYLSNLFKAQNQYVVDPYTNNQMISSTENSFSSYYYKYKIQIACNIHR